MIRRIVLDRPLDLHATIGHLQRGAGDPTGRRDRGGWWRTLRTPAGAVTLHVTVSAGEALAEAWGPGADWALSALPGLLGEDDDPSGLRPAHPRVAEALRRAAGLRIGRTGLVVEALVPAVIEQKVTGQEAFGAYRRLVRAYGEPGPGPGAALGLVTAPSAEQWRRVPSWEWLRAGVDASRADTLQRALAVAPRLEECARLDLREAHRRLRTVPGIGVWTAAEVRQRALGDPDAVSFGDYHLARDVGWILLGREVDDQELAQLLAPYTGHRHRVVRLLLATYGMRPRHGPRMSPRTHLPTGGRGRGLRW